MFDKIIHLKACSNVFQENLKYNTEIPRYSVTLYNVDFDIM